ncbi:MAG TPA: SDR family NAD(P)-dependent oxidoreductase [Ilumatobacteraceae bacterium]|nr:SDR family NAD(P)-dependent oxidoreductase [Ilumatobacteraceae bacterium]HRB02123.1 SDR family NAD(P)-dependent oxidoreductase [Ilumatobacteraceae bacterium]
MVTGSTTGLGLAAAQELIDAGHEVLVHARGAERAAALGSVAAQAAGLVIGDLGEVDETLDLAQQVNRYGRVDAVIHNAGFYDKDRRSDNSRGQPVTFAVNVVAPYLLTALLERPSRLIYLSSNMHTSGSADLVLGHRTQVWLATSEEQEASVRGRYWFRQDEQSPAAPTLDTDFQDRLIARLTELTRVPR